MTINEIMKRYVNEPVKFAHDILGFTTLEPWQCDVLDAIVEYDRVAVKGANGIGKGAVMSVAGIHFFTTRPYAKVPTTSGSQRQVKMSLWSEITKLAAQSKIREHITINATDIIMKGHKAWYMTGFSTDEAPRAEGWHADNLLFILDEARAIPDEIFLAAFKACTGPGNKILAGSIPGGTEGMFHKIFTSLRRSWKTFSIPAAKYKHGRYKALYPHRVSQQSIDEKLQIDGEASPFFRSSVLAEFVQSEEDSLIPTSLILKARTNELEPGNAAPVHGLDIARYGRDSSCICTRTGPVIQGFKQQRGLDVISCSTWAELESQGQCLCLDECGIGAGVLDALRAKGAPNVHGVNVAERARDPERYFNRRAELYWLLREKFEKQQIDLSRLDTQVFDKLHAQLASIRYRFKAGKVLIESKEDLKKRGLPSPDLADALALSFAMESEGTWNGPLVISESIAGAMLHRSWESPPEREQLSSGIRSIQSTALGCPPDGIW